ncbi:MAG: FMN-binding protein [Vicinamibacteria bacterium]
MSVAFAALALSFSVILTEREALDRAFPEATFERKVLYLTEEQVERVQKEARSRLPSAVVTMIEARSGEKLLGRAYLDTHIVRTMPETLLTAIAPDGRLKAALVLQFAEPPDYLPREKWLTTFEGKKLDDDLWPGRGVYRVTGATLTVQALTEAVRRSLAIDRVAHSQER